MLKTIAKGTKVRIRTDNGGEIVSILTSTYRESYAAEIEDGSGIISGWRIVSVEVAS